MKRSWLVLVVGLCLAFGLRALLLIDATALWSDELYSVGKSFQPSFSSLLLAEDTHPPAYYSLLWLWGHLMGRARSASACSVVGLSSGRIGDGPSGDGPCPGGHQGQGGVNVSAVGLLVLIRSVL